MEEKKEYIRINAKDMVAVAMEPLEKGRKLKVNDIFVTIQEDIPQGHKFALKDIKKGEKILKYGNPIGIAKEDIQAGSWVHIHNMRTNLGEVLIYTYQPEKKDLPAEKPEEFMGFRRADGNVGVRNEIWIIPTVGCVNNVAGKIAEFSRKFISGTVDDVIAFPHPYGFPKWEKIRKIPERFWLTWYGIQMPEECWFWDWAVKTAELRS